MLEKKYQTLFSRWLSKQKMTGAFELKVSEKGKALPFSRLADHQERALLATKLNCIVFKIPDVGIGIKPFDCFSMCGAMAFVVVFWKGSKVGYMIDIEKWVAERENEARRSLTELRASEIGIEISFR